MEHAGDFVKNNGEQEVYDKIVSFYLMPVCSKKRCLHWKSGWLRAWISLCKRIGRICL